MRRALKKKKKNLFIEEKQSRKETKKGSSPDADPPRAPHGSVSSGEDLDNNSRLGQAVLVVPTLPEGCKGVIP